MVNIISQCKVGFRESSPCRNSWVYTGFPGEVLHTRGVIRPVLPAGRFTERPSLVWEKTWKYPAGYRYVGGDSVWMTTQMIQTGYKYFGRSFSTTCDKKYQDHIKTLNKQQRNRTLCKTIVLNQGFPN